MYWIGKTTYVVFDNIWCDGLKMYHRALYLLSKRKYNNPHSKQIVYTKFDEILSYDKEVTEWIKYTIDIRKLLTG